MITVPTWIPYPRADEILRCLSDVVEHASVGAGYYVLAGPPNNGKTAIADRLQQLYPPTVTGIHERSHFPVLALDMPPTPSLGRIIRATLRKVGAPVIRIPLDQANACLGRVLSSVRTRLIVLDDAQHLLTGSCAQHSAFLAFWKNVSARSEAALVFVGSAQVLELVPEAQLLPLPAWPLDADFAQMAQALEHQVSPEHVVIGSEQIPALHSLCAGRLGVLVAAIMALGSRPGWHTLVPWDERFQRAEHAV